MTRSSHVSQSEQSSCRWVRAFRWNVDSICLDGDAGDCGCNGCAGFLVGVEGPLKDASLLLIVRGGGLSREKIRNIKARYLLLKVPAKQGLEMVPQN